MDFRHAKFQQLDGAASYRIYGHELEFERDAAPTGAVARRGWRLVHPCYCVHDSPQNPCRCVSGPFFWLSRGGIIGEGNSGRKDQQGKELQYFDVLVDSKIMVETVRPVSAGVLKSLGEAISDEAVLWAACESDFGGLGVAAKGLIPAEWLRALLGRFPR